ncbi:MAG: SDR family oxidoreductase, partial [Myxococcales bacterium]|nr:SDR family oxidoreductase [Myxococcales bacterium]
IHNAGILERNPIDDLDFDSVRRQFEVNAMGPLRVVTALRGLLAPGAKIALVTSRMGSIADNDSGGSYGYRMSKAALNMAGKSLSIDLRAQGISVALLHPDWVRTDMTGHSGLIDAETSARGLLARIDALSFETSGGFWHQDGQVLPW